jgi:hypothetical protein
VYINKGMVKSRFMKYCGFSFIMNINDKTATKKITVSLSRSEFSLFSVRDNNKFTDAEITTPRVIRSIQRSFFFSFLEKPVHIFSVIIWNTVLINKLKLVIPAIFLQIYNKIF